MGNITALTRSGVKDFLIQRVTALIIMAYALFIMGLIICIGLNGSNGYVYWMMTFECTAVKVFTVLAFVSLIAHAWIGMWTVITDYVHCAWLRGTLLLSLMFGYLACFVWLIFVLFYFYS